MVHYRFAHSYSGEVIDVRTHNFLTTLQDEFYNNVASEKMVEIDLAGKKAVWAGDHFGFGGIRKYKVCLYICSKINFCYFKDSPEQ